jgi:DNA repair protein RAD5
VAKQKALIDLFSRLGLGEDLKELNSINTPNEQSDLGVKDINNIYAAALSSESLGDGQDPAAGFLLDLRKYQKQALTYMISREKNEPSDNHRLSPLWHEYTLPSGSHIYFSPFNGKLSKTKPLEKSCKGGILADEMGLGKTIQILALIHSNQYKFEKNGIP